MLEGNGFGDDGNPLRPVAPPQRIEGAIRRMKTYWLTYRAWMEARGLDVFFTIGYQPEVDDINRAVEKYIVAGNEELRYQFELFKWDLDDPPWGPVWLSFEGDAPLLLSHFTEDDFPQYFADVYKDLFVAWCAYRVMVAESVWRCFHYTRRAGAGNFTNHPGRHFIYPGHPDYDA